MTHTALLILVGICLYASINNLIFGARSPVDRSRLLFAGLSGLAAVFAIFESLTYQAVTVDGFLNAHQIAMSMALLFFIVLPWFAQNYLPVYKRSVIMGLNSVFVVLLLINLASDTCFYYENIEGLKQRTLPWGEQISYLQADTTLSANLVWIFLFAVFAYLLYGSFRQLKNRLRDRAIYLATSLLVFLVLASADFLIDYGYLEFVRMGVFGVLAMIISMSLAFSVSANQNIIQLDNKETHLRLAMQAANIGTWEWEIESNSVEWSSDVGQIFGLEADTFEGSYEAYMALLHPEDVKLVQESIRKSLEDKVPYYVEHKIIWPDKSEHWLECQGEVSRDSSGAPVSMRGTVMDITERKRTEQAVGNIAAGISAQTGDAFFRELVLHLAKLFDADYAFIGVLYGENKENVETIAVSSHGSISENLCYPLAGTPCEHLLRKSSCAYPDNVQEKFPDDKLLVEMGAHSYIGSPLYDVKGEVTGVMVILDKNPILNSDYITGILQIFATRAAAELARIKSEKRLQDAEQRLRLHVKETPLGVIEWDVDFRVTDWNEAAEKIFGFKRSEIMGKNAADLLLPGKDRQQVSEVWDALLKKKGGMRSTNDNLTKDGSLINCEWYNTPLVTDDDKVIGVASLVRDITERVEAQKALADRHDSLEEQVSQRTAELETANHELESFSYSVSHDLRTPLRSINGFSQALLEEYNSVLDVTGKDYLMRLINASERMAHLIDDLLELSRLGRSEMEKEDVDLSRLANYAIEMLRTEYPDRNVATKVASDIHVSGDARLLAVVVDNLIDNAWKYTGRKDKAHIEFGSTLIDNKPVYYVRDDGAGFDMRYADKLFGAFQRLHRSNDFAGTGIGLATVQRLIHRHGGKVWAEGEIDKGATFYFSLPE